MRVFRTSADRESNLLEAVLWHGGEAEASRQQVLKMNREARAELGEVLGLLLGELGDPIADHLHRHRRGLWSGAQGLAAQEWAYVQDYADAKSVVVEEILALLLDQNLHEVAEWFGSRSQRPDLIAPPRENGK